MVVREEPTRRGSGVRGETLVCCCVSALAGLGLKASEAPIHAYYVDSLGMVTDTLEHSSFRQSQEPIRIRKFDSHEPKGLVESDLRKFVEGEVITLDVKVL